MGIHNFLKIIRECAPQAYRQISMSELRGRRIVLDANLFVWRFMTGPTSIRNKHLQYTSDMVDYLRYHDIRPVFVFDGNLRVAEKVMVAHRKRAEVTRRTRVHADIVRASLDRHQTVHDAVAGKIPSQHIEVSYFEIRAATRDAVGDSADDTRDGGSDDTSQAVHDHVPPASPARPLPTQPGHVADSTASSTRQAEVPASTAGEVLAVSPIQTEPAKAGSLVHATASDVIDRSKPTTGTNTWTIERMTMQQHLNAMRLLPRASWDRVFEVIKYVLVEKERPAPAEPSLQDTLQSNRAAAVLQAETDNMPRPAVARLEQEVAMYDLLETDPAHRDTLLQNIDALQKAQERLDLRLVRPTSGSFSDVQLLLRYLGVPYVISENYVEAEHLGALFVQHGFADAVATEDTDVAVFLPDGKVVRDLFRWQRQPYELDTGLVRRALQLSDAAFVDFCILCGCDFSGTIAQVGCKRALKYMQQYGSVERLLDAQPALTKQLTDDWDLEGARNVFTSPSMTVEQLQALFDRAMDTEARQPAGSLTDYLDRMGIEPFTEAKRQQYAQ
ncbi:hypothetical protein RI367_002491 [Sorochytrium milnesiophthora]